MSGGGSSSVSNPNSVKKIIQNIKEIAGNHSDDEIYAMLKECSMDPNETAQKLLLQDTFHEVRRKRDKKKEILNNREPADSRWRPGAQGRGSRGGRGNFSPRFVPHDAGVAKNASTGKENGVIQGTEISATPSSLPASHERESKATAPASSSITVVANGPTSATGRKFSRERVSQPGGSGTNPSIEAVPINKLGSEAPSPPANSVRTSAFEFNRTLGQPAPSSQHSFASQASVSGVYSSASDPVLVPSSVLRTAGAVGTLKCEVGNQRTSIESNSTAERSSIASRDFTNRVQANKLASHDGTSSDISSSKAASESGTHTRMPSKSQGVEKNQFSESSRPSSSSTHGVGSSTSRPSSNYGSRSQQLIGSHKVGPSKEWKPKPATYAALPSQPIGTSVVLPVTAESNAPSVPTSSVSASEGETLKLQKKLEELRFSEGQHVIIPNHLHVPEAERTGLSFGSFDASFGVSTSYSNGPDNDQSSTPLTESSESLEETAEEPSSSNQSASQTVQEEEYPGKPQSPKNVPESMPAGEVDVSSNSMPESDNSKPEATLLQGGIQYPVVHTAPHYSNFGFVPPVLGTQFASYDSNDVQSRDASRFTSFVGGNSVVLSAAGSTPLVTQAAGVMQSSLPMTPQPLHFFRQPPGLQISQYPGYIPYNQYIPQIYLSHPYHQFHTAFTQQAPSGNLYPAPTATAATGAKLPPSHYKPLTNAGNSTQNGMPTGYGQYCSPAGGYGPTSTATTGNSTGNEELAASQFKENNVYIQGQGEGPAVWIPGRDISGLPASSFYNFPPQGQPMTYATQAGHGSFTGMYHPGQTIPTATTHPLLTGAGAGEMVGPTTGVYQQQQQQQPQRTQINWNNNY